MVSVAAVMGITFTILPEFNETFQIAKFGEDVRVVMS
jgi:hypothetical protein